MKECKKCHIEKPLDQFYKTNRGWLLSYCKSCETVIKREYVRNHREEDNKRTLAYYNKHKNEPEYKKKRNERLKIYNKTVGASHMTARLKVKDAIKAGRIIKPDSCLFDTPDSGCRGRLEAHHYLGYEPEHWFDIQWLCLEHHHQIHREQRTKLHTLLGGKT